jgi:hypothetical protein
MSIVNLTDGFREFPDLLQSEYFGITSKSLLLIQPTLHTTCFF